MAVVLVTGGSKGIGLATVAHFNRLGFQVVTCGRKQESWSEAVSRDSELQNVDFQSVDLADQDQIEQFFSYIKLNYKQIDIAVNNASSALQSTGVFAEVSDENLFSTLNIDFWAQALCLKREIKLMSRGARIVNVSSINGLKATPQAAMYSAAKHGMEGLTRSVALELIEQGIRVNAVAPGVTWTARWEDRQKDTKVSLKDEVARQVPIQRFAEVEEVVAAIAWLSSSASSYVVGHTLVVDGGLSLI